MAIRPFVASMAILSAMLLDARSVAAQSYPTKPIHIIAAEAGGSGEFLARIIAQGIAGPLGQAVVIDNRSSTLTGGILASSPPDGYTIGVNGSVLWLTPFIQKTTFDPIRDFAPISSLSKTPNVLIVNPALPVKSVSELIALAKAKPGMLNYASGPVGGGTHLTVELFKSMAGVNIVRIPYKGVGLALTSVIAGDTQMMITTSPASAMSEMRSGKVRALAVTSAEPSPLAPGLPTISASGLPGYASENINGILAPAKTPSAIINRLNKEIVRVLATPEAKEKIFGLGLEVATSTPEQFAATIKSEMAVWGKVIKDAGIQPD